MDLFDALEQMALNASDEINEPQGPSQAIIARWEKLFGYSHTEAIEKIERHRGDLSRKRLCDEHWEMVREEKEAQGYDREAYEHEHEVMRRHAKQPPTQAPEVGVKSQIWKKERFIVKLEGPLTPAAIWEATQSKAFPMVPIVEGSGEEGDAKFCVVDFGVKEVLLERLKGSSFKPAFIRDGTAEKRFSGESKYPTLGLDTTLPQNRPSRPDGLFVPVQDEYPVWYFFYGTLADSTVLTRHLSLTEEPKFYPAIVKGGVLETWGGKYQALVDGPETKEVQGSAYMVMTKEHEDALRFYETDKYEVVRCSIQFKGSVVQGCTFRFVGEVDSHIGLYEKEARDSW